MGKSQNPVDVHRRAERKREIKRNKANRTKVRDTIVAKTRSVTGVSSDIDSLEKKRSFQNGHLDANDSKKLERLRKELRIVREVAAKKAKEDAEMKALEDKERRKYERTKEGVEEKNKEKYGENAKLSVYYDPVLNPFGAAPPGKPMLYWRRGGGKTMRLDEAVLPESLREEGEGEKGKAKGMDGEGAQQSDGRCRKRQRRWDDGPGGPANEASRSEEQVTTEAAQGSRAPVPPSGHQPPADALPGPPTQPKGGGLPPRLPLQPTGGGPPPQGVPPPFAPGALGPPIPPPPDPPTPAGAPPPLNVSPHGGPPPHQQGNYGPPPLLNPPTGLPQPHGHSLRYNYPPPAFPTHKGPPQLPQPNGGLPPPPPQGHLPPSLPPQGYYHESSPPPPLPPHGGQCDNQQLMNSATHRPPPPPPPPPAEPEAPALPPPSEAVKRTLAKNKKKGKCSGASVAADIWASNEEIQYHDGLEGDVISDPAHHQLQQHRKGGHTSAQERKEKIDERDRFDPCCPSADGYGSYRSNKMIQQMAQGSGKKRKDRPRGVSTEQPPQVVDRWYYIDNASGAVQGPFGSAMMVGWRNSNFFPPATPMRNGESGPFRPLSETDLEAPLRPPPPPLPPATLAQSENVDNEEDDKGLEARIRALKGTSKVSAAPVKSEGDVKGPCLPSGAHQAEGEGALDVNEDKGTAMPGVGLETGPAKEVLEGAVPAASDASLPGDNDAAVAPLALDSDSPPPVDYQVAENDGNVEPDAPAPDAEEEEVPYPVDDSYPVNDEYPADNAYPVTDSYGHGNNEEAADADYPAVAPYPSLTAYPASDGDDNVVGAYPVGDAVGAYPIDEMVEVADAPSRPMEPPKKAYTGDKAVVGFVPSHLQVCRKSKPSSSAAKRKKSTAAPIPPIRNTTEPEPLTARLLSNGRKPKMNDDSIGSKKSHSVADEYDKFMDEISALK